MQDGQPGEVRSRYRPIQLHARGGLGEVYLAEDQELNRQVALKRIQEQHAQRPESRRRFLIEAELTGRLEHPGVVPVYGLIREAGGEPSYAMRFIRGESLAAAVQRFHSSKGAEPKNFQSVEFRQLLQRFIAVCNTVGFAHNRGVMHRDLKPSNIMLGEYGETLVVDWGLARATDGPSTALGDDPPGAGSSDASRTETGQLLGTPAYMSPEQAAGQWDKVGPASDIYSLGATLYSVLSGKLPFAGPDVQAVIEDVKAGRAIPLEQQGRVPPPLVAICRKAMSLRAEDRYATALALATDLEQWLADERVSAWPEPWRVRAARWTRRHRTLVTSTLAAGGVALVGFALATLLLERARRSEAEAKDQAMTSYRMAHQAFAESVNLVADDPRVKEGPLEDLRQRIFQAQAAFFEKFLALQSDQPEFQHARGVALLQYGRIKQELGSMEEAAQLFKQGRAIFRLLAQIFPDNLDCHYGLFEACNNLGGMYQNSALSSEDAIAAYKEAIGVLESLERRGLGTADDKAELGTTHSNLGYAYYLMGQWQEAEQEYQAALAILNSAAIHDKSDFARRKLAGPMLNLALLYHKSGRDGEAQQAYGDLLTLLKALLTKDPDDRKIEAELAEVQVHLAIMQHGRDLTPEAEQTLQDAMAGYRSLVARHPMVTEYRRGLARSQHTAATTYLEGNRLEEADGLLQEALSEFLLQVKTQPTVPRHRADLATCYITLGEVYHEMHRPKDAEDALRSALQQFQHLASEHPAIPEYADRILKCYQELGDLFENEGRTADAQLALEEADKALSAYRDLLQRQNVNLDQSLQLGKLLFGAGQAAILQHRDETALSRIEEAIALLEPVHFKDPQRADGRSYLATSYGLRSAALSRLGRHNAALQSMALAEELADSLEDWQRRTLRMERAAIQARLKRHEKATAEARAVLADPLADDHNFYDASCVFAVACGVVQQNNPELAEQYAASAMTLLRTAVDKGFTDWHTIKVDKDLDSLRERQDFQMFIKDHEKPGR